MLKPGAGSLEFECLSQLGSIAWVDFKDAAERVWMTPVCKFCEDKETKQEVNLSK